MKKIKVLSGILAGVSYIGWGGINDQTSTNTSNKPKFVKVIDVYKDITRGYCYFRVPVQISNSLVDCINKVKEKYPYILDKMEGWNTTDYLHATISFPVNITAEQSEKISNELEEVLKSQKSLTMELKSTLEVWHNRVVVAPIKITDELVKFENNVLTLIRKNLPDYATKYEKNGPVPYKPHITLGYIKRDLSEEIKQELSNKISNILAQDDFENITWNANEFELGRSANNLGSYYSEPYVVYSF